MPNTHGAAGGMEALNKIVDQGPDAAKPGANIALQLIRTVHVSAEN